MQGSQYQFAFKNNVTKKKNHVIFADIEDRLYLADEMKCACGYAAFRPIPLFERQRKFEN
jgi:hypothetical protein